MQGKLDAANNGNLSSAKESQGSVQKPVSNRVVLEPGLVFSPHWRYWGVFASLTQQQELTEQNKPTQEMNNPTSPTI